MKGKYINTVIWMAALSNRKNKLQASGNETISSLQNHRVIWMKATETNKTRLTKTATVSH